MRAIIITGTPGTGKSELAKALAKKLGCRHINVNRLAKRLSEGYDRERKTSIVDVKKLNTELMGLIKASKKRMVIDSHLSHYLPEKYVKLCIVTKCSIRVLKKRLEKRKYSQKKVRENLDCEIFDVCRTEAEERYGNVLVLDTTRKSPSVLAGEILSSAQF